MSFKTSEILVDLPYKNLRMPLYHTGDHEMKVTKHLNMFLGHYFLSECLLVLTHILLTLCLNKFRILMTIKRVFEL